MPMTPILKYPKIYKLLVQHSHIYGVNMYPEEIFQLKMISYLSLHRLASL